MGSAGVQRTPLVEVQTSGAVYQVTPVILGGGGRHGKSRSDHNQSTGE